MLAQCEVKFSTFTNSSKSKVANKLNVVGNEYLYVQKGGSVHGESSCETKQTEDPFSSVQKDKTN